MADQPSQSRSNQLQERIRRFSRVEKAFYGSIILTAINQPQYRIKDQRN